MTIKGQLREKTVAVAYGDDLRAASLCRRLLYSSLHNRSHHSRRRKGDRRSAKTLRTLALERMREAIMDFHFQPGERLVERPLCDQLGVAARYARF
ncbi:hypothetical protein [Mesorhizobium argentiipisi]|uniref:HTH gntR-type domain-containing protein n=1 Tax=Mesorhizobium argentiipisi TaxID=3015175 RepID=A0ABU8K535_9HYPH